MTFGTCCEESYACEIKLRPCGPVLYTAAGLTNGGAVGLKRESAGELTRTAVTFCTGVRDVLIDRMVPFSTAESRRDGELVAICLDKSRMMEVAIDSRKCTQKCRAIRMLIEMPRNADRRDV